LAPVVNLVSVLSDTKVNVWFYPSASTDVKKYEVYQIKNGGTATLVATMLNPTLVLGKIKYIDSNLTCLKDRYCYYVVARDSCSNIASAASNIHCDVQLSNTVGNKRVFLSWTKYIGRGIKNYKITKLTATGYTTIYTGNGTDSLYTDSNGLSCGLYSYQIQAVDSTGLLISISDSTTAQPYDSTKPLAPVVNLVSVLTDTSVDIFYYKSSSNVKNIELYQSTNGGSYFLATTFTDTTTTTNYLKYTLKNLNCLKDKYCFYLIARDSCSNLASPASNIHCDIQLLGTPGNNKAYINWNKYIGRGIMTYRIRKKAGAGFTIKYIGNGTDSTYIDSVGVNCGPNYYKVEAWDSTFTLVSYSDTICVIPNDTVPPIVASIKKVTLLTQNKIYLHWAKSSSDVNRYILYRSVNNTSPQPYDTLTSADTSYIDSFTNTSQNYYAYSIEAFDSCKSLSSGLAPTQTSINIDGVFNFCLKKYDIYWNKYINWKSGVSGYQVLRSVNDSAYSVMTTVTAADSHYIDTVSYNRIYKYKIKAIELNGGFENSISDSVTLFFKPIKGPKLNVVSKTATSSTNGSVRISFDVTYYDTLIKYARIYHSSTGASGTYSLIKDSIPVTQTYFDHNNINTSTSDHYYYMVNLDTCGLISDSNGFHKTMNLSVNQRKLRNTVYWTPYKGFTVQKYYIEKTDTNNVFIKIDSVASTDTTYLDYPAPCNEYVTYRITAFDNTGKYFSYSDTVTLPPIPINAKDSGTIYNVTVLDDKTILVEFYSTDSNDIYGYSVRHALNNGSFIQSKFYYFIDSGHQYMHIDSVNTLSDNHYYILYKMDSCLNAVPSKIFRQIQLQGFSGHLKNTLFFNKFEGYPISHYKIFENISNTWVFVDSLANTDTTYIHQPLLCNNTHQYKIIGYENGGYNRTTSSDTIWLTPFDSIPPDSVIIKYASVVDYKTIELAWKPSSADVGSYQIWMKSPSTSYTLNYIASKDDTVALINNLNTSDTIYDFVIYAIDSCSSNISSISKSHTSSIIYAKAGNKQAAINWVAYKGFTNDSQFVERYINGTWVTIYKTDTSTSFIDSNLGCNVTYYFRLKTYASNGYISYSDSVFVTPFDTVKPMPVKVEYISIVNDTQVDIHWKKSLDFDVKNYEIWRSDNGGIFSKIADLNDVNSFIDTNTNPQLIKHCYYIIAYDSCSSLNRSIASDTDCTGSIWHSFKGCYPEITLHWTPYQTFETGLFKYRIVRTDSIGKKAYFNVNPNANSYEDSSLIVGSTYCYVIESIDSSFKDTAKSFEYCAIPFVSTKPSKANIKYITISQTGNSFGSIEIAWSRNSSKDTLAIGYRLYHSSTTVPSDFTLLYTTKNLNDTIYTHDSINTSNARHYYYIEIFDYCNRTGDISSIHSPINLIASAGNLQSSLVWNRYEGWLVSGYDIYRNWTQNGNTYSWYMAQVDSGTFSFVDTNVSCGIDYQYIISANEISGLYTTLSNYDSSLVFDTIPPLPIKINVASVAATDSIKGIIQIYFNAANEKNKNGYKIYRSIDGNTYTLLNNFINNISGTLIYIDSNINTRSSVHSYFITATDSCGNESTPSDTHTVVNLNALAVNEAVDINWTAYKGFTSTEYTIERMDDAQLNWIEIVKLPAGASQFYDSSVICNRVYYYRIASRDINNNILISYSDTQYVLTFDITAPQPVEFKRVSVSHTSDWDGNVIVEWNESVSNDVAQYVIERRLKDDISWVQAGITGKVSSFVDAGLNTVDTVYIYRIKAIDSCGNESVYNTIDHGTINLHSAPAEQSILLNWGAYIGWPARSYRLYRNGEFLANVDSITYQYLDTPLTCTQLMNYQIVAINSVDTNIVSFSDSTLNRAVDHTPPAPTYLKYATVDTSNQQVKLEWNKAGGFDVAYYEIYRKYNGTKGWSKIHTTQSADTVYFDKVDHFDGSLCYRIVSSDSCSNFSEPSNEGCLVYLSGKSGNFLNSIQWSPYTDWKGKIKKYELWKTEDKNPKTLIASIIADSLKWLDSILTYDVRKFCYRVAAYEDTGSYGAISWSNEVCLQQQPIYWIPSAFTPNDDDLNETFGPTGIFIDHYEMTIYDRWGEKIFISSPQQQRWNGKFNNGSYVPGGLYMYQFKFYSYDGRMYNVPGTVYILR
jgi:gliding motility-associated-like protein